MKTIDQTLEAFDEKSIRSALCIYGTLKQNGYTIDHLVERVKQLDKEQARLIEEGNKIFRQRQREVEEFRKEWEEVAPLCPDCSNPLNPPRPILKKKGPENIYGWTCHWFCSSETCLYEKYTHEDAREEMKKIMERRTK